MNLTQLQAAIFDETHIPRATIARLIDIYAATLMHDVPHGDIVKMWGFGRFTAVHRSAGYYNNPRTGARTFVGARTVSDFRPEENLLKIVNGELTP